LLLLLLASPVSSQQEFELGSEALRFEASRFTVMAFPQDARLARAMLASAQRQDTFPGLPRPTRRVLIAIAPDRERFRAWSGAGTPEWGAAIAFPEQQRIIMQGASAGSDAGNPLVVLRHELAHLALHEFMGRLPPRWFDEGYASYAAGEWSREEAFATSLSLVWRTLPGIDSLDAGFHAGSTQAQWSYALAHRVVAELASIDPERGLTNLFRYWKQDGSLEVALRGAYGLTGEQFDQYWKRQTRRRYGALALVTNVSLFVGVLAFVLGPLMIMRRRRDRRRLEAMRAADAAQERAARESALEALLALGEPSPALPTPPEPPPEEGRSGSS
jgi:hypothetical protein